MTDYKNDKIATWDGDASTFQDFRDRCLWYRDGTSQKNIPEVAPRIAQKLTGKAWTVRIIITKTAAGR